MLIVTATDLPRLLACNGSRLLGGSIPPSDSDDTVRQEGNAAHWLVEQVHAGHFSPEELVDRKAPNGVYITADMVEYLAEYLAAVSTIGSGSQIETDTSHAGTGWQVNGRADLIKYDWVKAHLDAGDLKFGWGLVEPENNWSVLSHVFGWINANPDKPVHSATLTIYQPRPHHPAGRVRRWTITREQIDQLYNFMRWHLENIARAGEGSDQLNTGSHCYKCPALATCPAARKAALNAIDASERAFVEDVSNDQLSFNLDHYKRAIEILTQKHKAYSEMALHRIREGQIINNYGLENEQTNRVWQDHVTADLLLALTGHDLTKKELLTPAQVEKAGVDKRVVAAFTERRNKGVKLVRMDVNAKARKLFNNPERKN